MRHRYIRSGPGLSEAASPISQAVVAGDHCYVSGQLATDAAGRFQGGSVAREAELAFQNLFAALAIAGFTREDIVFVDVALLDITDMSAMNAVWADLFPESMRPARTVYEVAALPYGGKIKVQGVAIRHQPG